MATINLFRLSTKTTYCVLTKLPAPYCNGQDQLGLLLQRIRSNFYIVNISVLHYTTIAHRQYTAISLSSIQKQWTFLLYSY